MTVGGPHSVAAPERCVRAAGRCECEGGDASTGSGGALVVVLTQR